MMPWGFNVVMWRTDRLLKRLFPLCHGCAFNIGSKKADAKKVIATVLSLKRANVTPEQRMAAAEGVFKCFREAFASDSSAKTKNLVAEMDNIETEFAKLRERIAARAKKKKRKKKAKRRIK